MAMSPTKIQSAHLVQLRRSALARILWRTVLSVLTRILNSDGYSRRSATGENDGRFSTAAVGIQEVTRCQTAIGADNQNVPEGPPGTVELSLPPSRKGHLPREVGQGLYHYKSTPRFALSKLNPMPESIEVADPRHIESQSP